MTGTVKIASGVVGAAVLAGVALAAPASAAPAKASTHCATQAQYRKVKHGMTIARVARILGHQGKVQVHASASGYASEIRNYPTCSAYAVVDVSFSHNPHRTFRVDAKSGVFV